MERKHGKIATKKVKLTLETVFLTEIPRENALGHAFDLQKVSLRLNLLVHLP